jgi:hypothetical protein
MHIIVHYVHEYKMYAVYFCLFLVMLYSTLVD